MLNQNTGGPPKSGDLLRLSQIIGDKRKGIAPIIPVSRSTWFKGVADGHFPKGVSVAKRLTLWRAKDIDALINSDQAATNTERG